MKGDLTRDTFRPGKHYSSVRMQQGRVQMDADWNEQVDIDAHLARTQSTDVIGPSGVPKTSAGFGISALSSGSNVDLLISPGRIYVDGILCELEAGTTVRPGCKVSTQLMVPSWTVDGQAWARGQWVRIRSPSQEGTFRIERADEKNKTLIFTESVAKPGEDILLKRLTTYLTQPDYHPPAPLVGSKDQDLVYLDVWQHHVTALEDPEIRETALNGPDTATRTRTVWQVKVRSGLAGNTCALRFASLLQELQSECGGGLRARARHEEGKEEPYIIKPGAGYRRLENQLYRVEIHKSGKCGATKEDEQATFKWSRENGSVVVSWKSVQGQQLTVESLGRDKLLGFTGQEWVELTDDTRELRGESGVLVKLTGAENDVLTMDPATPPVKWEDFPLHPKVRRWDMKGGAITVEVPATNEGWIALEDGVEVKFDKDASYRCGDYWLIPARASTGDIEWPYTEPQPKHGIQHHYVCLALVNWNLTPGPPVERALVSMGPRGALPDLAWSWKVDERGLVCTFSLVQDAFLANEQPVTAAVVAKAVTDARIEGFGKCEVIDDYTISIVFPQVNAKVFEQLSKITISCRGTPTVNPVPEDCRLDFPPLTAITAGDVSFDDRKCNMGADTVQEALETLCARPAGTGHASYRALRYVGGDGQEGGPGQPLSCPLWVGVEDENGKPVSKAEVQFNSGKGDDVLMDVDDPGTTGPIITVFTNEVGIAGVRWTLGTQPKLACRAVIARLLKPPQTSALPVRFQAGIANLPRVEDINWDNDLPLALTKLAREGLQVTFSTAMNPATISPDTFIVTLELPEARDGFCVGHLAWIVPGTLTAAEGNKVWKFEPRTLEAAWLRKWFEMELSYFKAEVTRIRGRVLLKGSVIMAQEGEHFLDGEARAKLRSDSDPVTRYPTTDLQLPSGDGNEGSDFESWFYLQAT